MRLKQTVAAVGVALLVPVVVIASRAARDGTKTDTAKSAEPTSKARAVKASRAVETTTYTDLVASIDRRIKGQQVRATARDDDWLNRSYLAATLLERATLTGQIDDFERVQKVLDEALAVASRKTGPLDIAARFHFAVHRLDAAEALLDRMDARKLSQREERTEVAHLRAQIAMQRGDYSAAFEGFSDVAVRVPAIGTPDLALYHAKTGEAAQAEVLLEEALEGTVKDPRRRAWLGLQLARVAMDRGKYRVALERLAEADTELPGWWQIEEQVAEAYTALGDNEKAITAYESVLEKSGLPQAMDSLAGAYQHAGKAGGPDRTAKAKELIDRAEALWVDHLRRMPEMAMGHGLHHYLQFGTPEKALELALANSAARPGGESQVLLGRAYLKAGKPEEALAIARNSMATPFRSAAIHDIAAKAHTALGQTAEADAERERCFAINPFFQDQLHAH